MYVYFYFHCVVSNLFFILTFNLSSENGDIRESLILMQSCADYIRAWDRVSLTCMHAGIFCGAQDYNGNYTVCWGGGGDCLALH